MEPLVEQIFLCENDQIERSNREDIELVDNGDYTETCGCGCGSVYIKETCRHEYGSSSYQDNPRIETYECSKCGHNLHID